MPNLPRLWILMADNARSSPADPVPDPGRLAHRLGETAVYSPLWRRAQAMGLREPGQLLALAVQRGARHYAGVAPAAAPPPVSGINLTNEELIVLLLHGRNGFEPFLVRAAAELLRRCRLDPVRLARAARGERCERTLAYIAQAGARHDPEGAPWWESLQAALGPQREIPPGVLPHWSRFVALLGVGREMRPRGARWIGADA